MTSHIIQTPVQQLKPWTKNARTHSKKQIRQIADSITTFGFTSGSTLIAAHKTGRRAFVCELDPAYCDIILARWERFAKDEAEQVYCGLPLKESVHG